VFGREKDERYIQARDNVATVLRSYRACDWDGALAAIEAGRSVDSDGWLSELYRTYEKRILTFRDSPPPEGWNGVFVLQTK
jgi:adenylate cyclase